MELTPEQAAALRTIIGWIHKPEKPYLTLGGYAGTGKTTLIAELRAALTEQPGWDDESVAFCAFTGKAASVLRERLTAAKALLKKDSCGTIHSLIYKPRLGSAGEVEGWDRADKLEARLIVVDEASMLNTTIWNDLTAFKVPILAVGDHGQLPPIEGGLTLMQQPDLRLETIVRQAAGNPIIRIAHSVRAGHAIPFGSVQGIVRKYHLDDHDAGEVFDAIMEPSTSDAMVLCGTNRMRGGLNARVRTLRGFEEPLPQAGDTVICLKNNHKKALYNGMVGQLHRYAPYDDVFALAEVRFPGVAKPFTGSVVAAQFSAPTTLKDVTPGEDGQRGELFDFGYALTVHKAQGSEADRVVLFEERTRYMDDETWKRWLYTAVTRARQELVVFGR